MVGREVEDGPGAGELAPPVRPQTLPFLRREHLLLPADEVAEARGCRPRPGGARRLLDVGSAQVVEEHRGRQEVADDVVHHHQDDVLRGRSTQEMKAEEGPALQVEGAADQFGQPGRDGRGIERRRILDGEPLLLPGREVIHIDDAEDGHILHGRERAPDRLVAVDHPAERPPERGEIGHGADQAGAGHVVGGPGRHELVGIPEHMLAM